MTTEGIVKVPGVWQTGWMMSKRTSDPRYPFSREILRQAIWISSLSSQPDSEIEGCEDLPGRLTLQRFLTLHGLTQDLFRLGRHQSQAVNFRLLRTQASQIWKEVACA